MILPLILGLALKNALKEKLDKIIQVFPALSTVFIAFICGLVVALNKEYLLNLSAIIFSAVFLHNLFGLILGYGAGKLFCFDQKRCRTLSLEVGMQNAGLGAVLALRHFSSQTAIPNAFFATWCILTVSILAAIWARRR